MRAETLSPLSVPHRAVEDSELSGFKIPANTIMVTDLHSMHHDQKFWGDPENFRPERFLTEDGRLGKDHSLPFGGGEYPPRTLTSIIFTNFLSNELKKSYKKFNNAFNYIFRTYHRRKTLSRRDIRQTIFIPHF